MLGECWCFIKIDDCSSRIPTPEILPKLILFQYELTLYLYNLMRHCRKNKRMK